MRKGMMGVLAAGLATASLVAVTSSAEAQWRGHGGWGGGGARVAGFGGGGAWRGAYGGGWRGGYGHAWRGGYNRGWGGGGSLAAGAVLGAVTGAALASNYGYGGYGSYYGGYAPVSYGYAPAAYAYPAAVSYYEEYPTTVSYAVPAYYERRVQRVVLGAEHQDVLIAAVAQQVGDVNVERRLTAGVLAHQDAVEPHVGVVVDRAEVQQRAVTGGVAAHQVRSRDRASVPDHRVEAGVVHAGGPGLGRERHGDRGGEASLGVHVEPPLPLADPIVVEGERPDAVQALPPMADQLRTRVRAIVVGSCHV